MLRPGYKEERLKEPFFLPFKGFITFEGEELHHGRARALSLVSTTTEPSDENGFFNQDETTSARAYAALQRMGAMTVQFERSVQDVEANNGPKQLSQTGQREFSYAMVNENPFISKSLKVKMPSIDIEPFMDWFRALAALKGAGNDLSRVRPGRLFAIGGLNVKYRKGSNYGPFPFISGASKNNGYALLLHAAQSALWTSSCEREGKYSRADELFHSLSRGRCDVTSPDSIQLFARTGMVGPSKMVPHWDVTPEGLKATEASTGRYARMRPIQAVNATRNIALSGIAQMFTLLFKAIPGLHVGHPAYASNFLYEASSLFGKAHVYAEDLSNYDQHVSPGLRSYFISLATGLFSLEPWEVEFLEDMDHLDVYTCVRPSSKRMRARIHHEGGITTGSQLTTAEGTSMNLITLTWAISKLLGISVRAALAKNLNFALSMGEPTTGCSWGCCLKGDDLVIISAFPIRGVDMSSLRAEVGLKSAEEDGLVFLKNFIDTSKVIALDELDFLPEHLKGKNGFDTYGLVTQRLGSTFFPEYPIRHEAIAVIAMAERHRTVRRSPLYPLFVQELASALPSMLNNYADYTWLQHQMTTSAFRKSLDDYLRSLPSSGDAFMKELFRRRSIDAQTTVTSNLDLLAERANFLGFGSALPASPIFGAELLADGAVQLEPLIHDGPALRKEISALYDLLLRDSTEIDPFTEKFFV